MLGFSLLPPLIPHERGAIWLDRGVIFQKGVGCLWEEECLLLLSEQFSLCFMMYCTDFVEIVCLLHRKHKVFCCSAVCNKGHSLLSYTFPKSLLDVESPSLILLIHPNVNTKRTKGFVITTWMGGRAEGWACGEALSASYVFGKQATLTFSTVSKQTLKHWDLLLVCTCWQHEGFKQMESDVSEIVKWDPLLLRLCLQTYFQPCILSFILSLSSCHHP